MPIYSSIGIRASVGRGGRNESTDVMAVQKRLNELMNAPRVKLVVDGRNGPKTEAMIADFQKVVQGTSNPDGRVDPNGNTLRALNDGSSEGKWARMSMAPPASGAPGGNLPPRPGTGGLNSGQQLLEQEARRLNVLPSFDEMRRALIDTGFPPFKSFLGTITKIEEARPILNAWLVIRRMGFSPIEAAQFYKELMKWDPERIKPFLMAVAIPGSKVAKGLVWLSQGADKLNKIVVVVEVVDKFAQGDYLYGTTELYKQAIGKGVGWASLIEAVQSIAEGIMPDSVKNTMIFQVLRACDPIGLGAVGVDTVGTLAIGLVEMIVTGKMQPGRLERLVGRMKSGPTAFFAKLGDNLGDATYEMSNWTRDDWDFAVRSIPGFVASILD